MKEEAAATCIIVRGKPADSKNLTNPNSIYNVTMGNCCRPCSCCPHCFDWHCYGNLVRLFTVVSSCTWRRAGASKLLQLDGLLSTCQQRCQLRSCTVGAQRGMHASESETCLRAGAGWGRGLTAYCMLVPALFTWTQVRTYSIHQWTSRILM
jgi:hypothetical protein